MKAPVKQLTTAARVENGAAKNAPTRPRIRVARVIDRLNIGPIPTTKLNWLQPHEGNIIDFLFRNRAYQVA